MVARTVQGIPHLFCSVVLQCEDLNLNPRTHVQSTERLYMSVVPTLEDGDGFQEPATLPR